MLLSNGCLACSRLLSWLRQGRVRSRAGSEGLGAATRAGCPGGLLKGSPAGSSLWRTCGVRRLWQCDGGAEASHGCAGSTVAWRGVSKVDDTPVGQMCPLATPFQGCVWSPRQLHHLPGHCQLQGGDLGGRRRKPVPGGRAGQEQPAPLEFSGKSCMAKARRCLMRFLRLHLTGSLSNGKWNELAEYVVLHCDLN